MKNNCLICELEIESIDREYGRVVKWRGGEAHAYCRVIQAGVVPECPIPHPTDCTNLCVQARACENQAFCGCKCENIHCQIGKSVRALRAKGLMPWEGYIPVKSEEDLHKKVVLAQQEPRLSREEGEKLYSKLNHLMTEPNYLQAMSIIEQLVHNSRGWRNHSSVIKFASVAYYNTGHAYFAWHWAVTYLEMFGNNMPKEIFWGIDKRYHWQFREMTAFIEMVISICGGKDKITTELTNEMTAIQQEIEINSQKDDFFWSDVSRHNKEMKYLHQKMIEPFSNMIEGLNLQEVFNVIEIVNALNYRRSDDEFSGYLLEKPVLEAVKIIGDCLRPQSLDDLRDRYRNVLDLVASSGFASPMPERLTWKEYWDRLQVIILTEYISNLKPPK